MRQVLSDVRTVEREVRREHMWFIVRVSPYRTLDDQIAGAVITFTDVTHLKLAEDKSRRKAKLLQLSHDAIFVWSPAGGIESWNRGAQELYAFTSDEALGQVPHQLLRTNGPIPWSEIEDILQLHGTWQGEFGHVTKDGRSLTVLSRATRVFQPFTQADTTLDRSKGGLGLGLSLVKGLVEMHGGNVSVASEGPGKGAEFTVKLPLANADDERHRGPDSSRALPRAPSLRAVGTGLATELLGMPFEVPPGSREAAERRVLVIEDNPDAAHSLREVLEFDGHDVRVASTGPEGLALARTFRPDVVLCDIGLPAMDGYAVARAIRADEALKTTYLVALSGYALPEDLKRAVEAGFDRHIAKPPTAPKLHELMAGLHLSK